MVTVGAISPQVLSARRRAQWRFLIATLVIASLYLALEAMWQWGAGRLMYLGWLTVDPRDYAAQAVEISTRSAAREATLAPVLVPAAFSLGVEYGYLADTISQSELRGRPLGEHLQALRGYANVLGLSGTEPRRQRRSDLYVPDSLEEEAQDLAARIEQAVSPRARHLFLLGAHAGAELSELEMMSDPPWPPPANMVAKHATLAGVPETLWRPLTQLWSFRGMFAGDTVSALADYRSAIDALGRSLPTRAAAAHSVPARR